MHVCKAEGGILALAGLLLHLVALLLPLLLPLLYCMVLFLHLLALGWSPQNKEHGQKPSLSVHEELPCVLLLFWHSMSRCSIDIVDIIFYGVSPTPLSIHSPHILPIPKVF